MPNSAAAPGGEAWRVIKKYPNRRLYDTDTSSYITLAEVRQLVMSNEAFRVVDAKSGDDITRSILLQIILEEEAGGAPILSEAVLANTAGALCEGTGTNVFVVVDGTVLTADCPVGVRRKRVRLTVIGAAGAGALTSGAASPRWQGPEI